MLRIVLCAVLALSALAVSGPAAAEESTEPKATAMGSSQTAAEPQQSTDEITKISYSEIIDLVGDARGKVVLINFWASWCMPCREEIPELKRLRRDVPEDKLLVLGISLDTSLNVVRRLASRLGMNYPVYMGSRDVIDAYSIMAIPRTIIYDTQGKRVFSHEGYMNKAMLMRAVSSFMADAE